MAEYDFRSLSPTDFERLACDVLNADLGLHLHAFPAGKDGGVDLREVGNSGFVTVVQCKHYVNSGASVFMNAVKEEKKKPALKNSDRYIFVTSHGLSPDREKKVAKELGIPVSDVWSPHRLNQALGDHPEIEERNFKLWLASTTVLTNLLHAGLWQRTEARLEAAHRTARLWVDVPAYAEARRMLEDEGICIITGVGGVGKTFLAERLMLDAARDGWRVADLTRDLDEAWAASRSGEKHFYYFDDFLGENELHLDAVDKAAELRNFITFVRNRNDSARLLMTTRTQILTQATESSSSRLHELAKDRALYTLSVRALDPATRAEILTNHLYFSNLPADQHEQLAADNRVTALAQNPAFNPRLVSFVAGQDLSDSTADAVLRTLAAAFANPAETWKATFKGLTPLAKDILLTLATYPERSVPHQDLRTSCIAAESTLAWQEAFKSLEPTWAKLVGSNSERAVAFANPGCRDYLLGLLDDYDMAEERVTIRLGRLEQLVGLSQGAGLLTADPVVRPTARRESLAAALLEHKTKLASRINEFWLEWLERAPRSPSSILVRLGDVAALLRIYTSAPGQAWFAETVRTVLADGSPPVVQDSRAVLRLARRVHLVPFEAQSERDELALSLVHAGLACADTVSDLDEYESLPGELRTPVVRASAARRANRILHDEVDAFALENHSVEALQAKADEVGHRAAWYGLDIDVGPLLDLIDEASEEE